MSQSVVKEDSSIDETFKVKIDKMIKCLKIASKLGIMLSLSLEGQSALLKEKKVNFKG